jgi:TonB family protein
MTDYRHDIEKYIKGELTPAERHALERKALDDPFLAEALEGAELIKTDEFAGDVAELQKKLAGKKIIPFWMWPARIAAGLAIILVSGYIVWSVLEEDPAQDLALQKNETAAPPPTAGDSIAAAKEMPSAPTEQSGAGPAAEKDIASGAATPSKVEVNTQPITAKPEKTEREKETIIAEESVVEDIQVTEPIAQAKPIEKEADVAKTDDVQRAKKLAITSDDKKKEAQSGRLDAAPALAESRDAGLASSLTHNIIRGQVTSAEDGTPLPGINVILKGTTIGTATDAQGNYQITVTNTNPALVFSFIGLQSTEVQAENRNEVNIQMAVDATQLSEVVVTGYGVSTGESMPPTVDMAHPEIGNRAYKQYLEKNLRYPQAAIAAKTEGRVTVEFTIEPDGRLTHFNIIRGIGSGCDEELIRLIQEGPKWVPTKRDNVPVQDKAKVRLKFELPK